MSSLKEKIEDILPFVSKPGRYFGGEWGCVIKDPAKVRGRICLIFPDLYETGMSHTGHQVLYNAVNSVDGLAAERCYSPWPDMEAALRKADIPLYSLETYTPLSEFDALGFTIAQEICMTNILQVLNLAGLPLRASDRGFPLIIGGGPVASNPEPLAPFFDCFVLGDGEDVAVKILEIISKFKKEGHPDKAAVLKEIAKLPGVYVPSFFDVQYEESGRVKAIKNIGGGPEKVHRAYVDDLNTAPFPLKPIVPHIQAIHDRAVIEPARGCTQGCRFCQAGYGYRPYRMRSPELLIEQAECILASTGYTELALLALSTTDYPGLPKLVREISRKKRTNRLNCSLPSSRIDNIDDALAQELADAGRSSGLTLAIEAGSQRLRQVINKDYDQESIRGAVESAALAGFELLKLYFMIGLPTETDDDVRSIISCVDSVMGAVNRLKDEGVIPKGKRFRLRISVSNFVPKSHTPFQWVKAISMDEMERRQKMLMPLKKRRNAKLSTHDPDTSYLEMIFSRGDRRLAEVIEHAFNAGARFDAWREMFDIKVWMSAFEKAGINPDFYLDEIPLDAILPWAHLSMGVSDEFLRDEYENSMKGEATADCNIDGCTACGLQERSGGCFPARLAGGGS